MQFPVQCNAVLLSPSRTRYFKDALLSTFMSGSAKQLVRSSSLRAIHEQASIETTETSRNNNAGHAQLKRSMRISSPTVSATVHRVLSLLPCRTIHPVCVTDAPIFVLTSRVQPELLRVNTATCLQDFRLHLTQRLWTCSASN